MKAIILAAGRGSRMGKLTDELPKCMLPLKGKPLLNWQIGAITEEAGVTDIAVVCGYKKETVQANGITERFENSRWNETNMVRSLTCADNWLKREGCIISYGDIFYETSAVSSLIDCNAEIAITYDVNFKSLWGSRQENPLDDLETFKIDNTGKLLTIGNKPQSIDEIQGQYMGLLKFTPKGWQMTTRYLDSLSDQQVDKLDMTSLLRELIENNIQIQTVPYKGSWGEVDSASDLALYESA